MFNEGYLSSSEEIAIRADLCTEAIRIARILASLMPDEPEAQGLLALMLLTDSRSDARFADGVLVPIPLLPATGPPGVTPPLPHGILVTRVSRNSHWLEPHDTRLSSLRPKQGSGGEAPGEAPQPLHKRASMRLSDVPGS